MEFDQSYDTMPNSDPRAGLDHPEPLHVIVIVERDMLYVDSHGGVVGGRTAPPASTAASARATIMSKTIADETLHSDKCME